MLKCEMYLQNVLLFAIFVFEYDICKTIII